VFDTDARKKPQQSGMKRQVDKGNDEPPRKKPKGGEDKKENLKNEAKSEKEQVVTNFSDTKNLSEKKNQQNTKNQKNSKTNPNKTK